MAKQKTDAPPLRLVRKADIGKRIAFDRATFMALDLYARDSMKSFQELADEAFADLLAKHGRPIDLKEALRAVDPHDGRERQSDVNRQEADQAQAQMILPLPQCRALGVAGGIARRKHNGAHSHHRRATRGEHAARRLGLRPARRVLRLRPRIHQLRLCVVRVLRGSRARRRRQLPAEPDVCGRARRRKVLIVGGQRAARAHR